ncbi:putative serine protease PepD [Streptomyces sp. Ag82_O1-12]|uniref:S1C family serine protease n=1 Tax=unclassified Streptomyces TaxID=2593676 RepID=UPI000BDBE20F|nr:MULTISPECIES: trypsin-like peptidase domain-containing protein [unclassified Streptomyces]SMQ18716.1 putative serine protease PepD [Streptomyces sp. Ag82_O1-12]SOD47756.1 putative serine protease PepD [Streptomyces sp. Ag82_G6-1]
MNEGKPTKAKWWSRPRPQDLSEDPDGTGGAREPATAPADPTDRDGDFELARPAARTDADGDYELRRPEAVPAAASTASGEAPAEAAVSVPAAREAEQDAPVASAAPSASPATPAEGAPKPLHDPDPYSTPPYGEPGPWAPAPPVQHPAPPVQHPPTPPTPVQGVAIPGQPTVPGNPTVPTEMPPPGAPGVSGAPAPLSAAPVYAEPPAPAPASDPWQRYDPWAAPAAAGGHGPLQQNGAAVLSTEQRRKRGKKSLVLGAVLLALVSGGFGGVVGTYLERNGGVGSVELPQAGKEAAARDADSVAGIAGRALPSVVTLHVSGSGEQGTGTGFVLDTRGHILTNNHVVQPGDSGGEITVTFNGGQTAQAEVVGRDSGYDLAVVKVKGVSGLTPLPLGNSDNVQVGDPVVAIGAPFDLAGTVTSGIISAKQRPITAGGDKGDGSDVSYVDALQTDAPINPGNSGGPLLDTRARVIGINSAIRSADSGSTQDSSRSGSIGLGFAIPINQGKRVAEELINTGKATHPVIGITLDMDYSGDGARVATEGSEGGAPVTAGGPGAKAGLTSGDVITEVDGRRVHSGEELIVKTRARRPGDRLELTVERGGKERKVSLVLGSSGG